MQPSLLSYLVAYSSAVIGLAFAVSFVRKLPAISQFEQAVAGFRLLPRRWSKVAALLFLAGEALIPILLILGDQFLTAGLILACMLLVVFSIALASVLLRKIQTTCNCFGASGDTVSVYDIGRNIVLIGCALLGLAALVGGGGLQNLGLVEWAVILFAAAVPLAILLSMRDIVQLLRQPQ